MPLKKAMSAYQERLQQEQHKYETLKLHAAQKLEGLVTIFVSSFRFYSSFIVCWLLLMLNWAIIDLNALFFSHSAQQEMDSMKRNLESETSRVKAVLKKTEMRLASLEKTLDQKTKENEELTKLCDELINKLGSDADRWLIATSSFVFPLWQFWEKKFSSTLIISIP